MKKAYLTRGGPGSQRNEVSADKHGDSDYLCPLRLDGIDSCNDACMWFDIETFEVGCNYEKHSFITCKGSRIAELVE
jgi:hypothetical protein